MVANYGLFSYILHYYLWIYIWIGYKIPRFFFCATWEINKGNKSYIKVNYPRPAGGATSGVPSRCAAHDPQFTPKRDVAVSLAPHMAAKFQCRSCLFFYIYLLNFYSFLYTSSNTFFFWSTTIRTPELLFL